MSAERRPFSSDSDPLDPSYIRVSRRPSHFLSSAAVDAVTHVIIATLTFVTRLVSGGQSTWCTEIVSPLSSLSFHLYYSLLHPSRLLSLSAAPSSIHPVLDESQRRTKSFVDFLLPLTPSSGYVNKSPGLEGVPVFFLLLKQKSKFLPLFRTVGRDPSPFLGGGRQRRLPRRRIGAGAAYDVRGADAHRSQRG